MPEPRLSVPEVPSPTPDVNEVRLRLEAIRSNARSAKAWPLSNTLAALDGIADLAVGAIAFLPGDPVVARCGVGFLALSTEEHRCTRRLAHVGEHECSCGCEPF